MKSLRIVERVTSGITVLFVWTCFLSSPAVAQPLCVGDCNNDGVCMIDELVLGVNIGLEIASVAECPTFDVNGDGYVRIDEWIMGVNNALLGCSPRTFTVTKTEDTNDGSCDSDCSLREAIVTANASAGADTVEVPAGTYILTLEGVDEDLAATGDLDITDSLTLTGAGEAASVIDGNASDRVLHVIAGTARISGVAIQNGFTDEGGGVHLDSEDTVLELTNETISGNTAHVAGGINNYEGAAVILTNTTVRDNTATENSGGILNGRMTLVNSVVSGNLARSAGGIRNLGMLVLRDTTVIGNTAERSGGGLVNGGIAELRDSTVSDNASGGAGGGIYYNGNRGMELTNTTVSSNMAEDDGGGIFNGGTLTLINSTVSGNTTEVARGGGIANDGGELTLTNSTISGNSAEADSGGGIANGDVTTLTLTHSIVAGNTAASRPDCYGNPISLGHNLIGDATDCDFSAATGDLVGTAESPLDALLSPLADYGGPTDTHGLCTGPGMPDASCIAASPALDAGDNAGCPATDQRGVERPQPAGGFCDIGAYEAE